MVFVCIGPFAWGMDVTKEGAVKRMKSNLPGPPYYSGSKAKAPYKLYRNEGPVDEVRVSELGAVMWEGPGRMVLVEDKTEQERKGA